MYNNFYYENGLKLISSLIFLGLLRLFFCTKEDLIVGIRLDTGNCKKLSMSMKNLIMKV